MLRNFTVQFPLKTEKYQEDILDKRFEIGGQIYNSLVNITQKRYKEMIKTKRYRGLMSRLSGDKKKDKPIWEQINEIRKQFGISEYSFYKDVQELQHHFSNNIDALTARSIASNLWRAYEKLFFGNGEQIHYKSDGCLNSLTGKTYKKGIRFKNDTILWNGFNGIKVQRDMYSSFLIMNTAEDLKSFDINKCNERFGNFYRLHNLEVERLTGHKNLSSMGI